MPCCATPIGLQDCTGPWPCPASGRDSGLRGSADCRAASRLTWHTHGSPPRFGSFEIFKCADELTGRAGPSVGRNDLRVQMLNYVIGSFYPEVQAAHTDPVHRNAAFFREVGEPGSTGPLPCSRQILASHSPRAGSCHAYCPAWQWVSLAGPNGTLMVGGGPEPQNWQLPCLPSSLAVG